MPEPQPVERSMLRISRRWAAYSRLVVTVGCGSIGLFLVEAPGC